MASVSFNPGAPSVTANFIDWTDRNPPDALVDASSLSADSDPRYAQRVRMWRTTRTGRIYVNFVNHTPDGGSGFGSRDDLTTDWEDSAVALQFEAGGQT